MWDALCVLCCVVCCVLCVVWLCVVCCVLCVVCCVLCVGFDVADIRCSVVLSVLHSCMEAAAHVVSAFHHHL